MSIWHVHDAGMIASARLPPQPEIKSSLISLVTKSKLSYSGIVLAKDDSGVTGEGIETSCYENGGLLWILRDYMEMPEPIGEFPVDRLTKIIGIAVYNYGKDILHIAQPKVTVDAAWAVCQRDGDYATVHDHTSHRPIAGKFVSGIYYLQVPIQIDARNFPNGCLHFVDGRTVTYVPPIADCVVMWPAEMLHGAHPFRGPGDRLAVAFNCIIEGDLDV